MDSKEAKQLRPRIRILVFIAALTFALLGLRLWYMQIVRGAAYEQLSEANAVRSVLIPAPRGDFLDRNGNILVTNRLAYSASVLPETLGQLPAKQQRRTLQLLSQLTGVPLATIQQELRLSRARSPYAPVPVLNNLDAATLIRLEERAMDLPGVLIQDVPLRYYPYGQMASQVFGYLGRMTPEEWSRLKGQGYSPSDVIGQTGLEADYQQYLRGRDGGRQVEVDNLGRPVKILGTVAPVAGDNVRLTLDWKTQLAADEALREELAQLQAGGFPRARAGAVVALDPRNGQVLAMASAPGFDPNQFVGGVPASYWNALVASPDDPLENRAIQNGYAPGSTFKVIPLIGALEDGKTTPTERFWDAGFDRVYPQKKSWTWFISGGGLGWQTLPQAVQNSVDTVFYELGRRLGIDRLAYWARRLGLGHPTGLRLSPGEFAGLIPDTAWKRRYYAHAAPYMQIWYPIETLDVAIGQGAVQATPLQMAHLYAAIANGGTFYRPYIVDSVVSPAGKVILQNKPVATGHIPWSPSTRQVVDEGLQSVPTQGTAAGVFRDFPIPVSGKTGTAQISALTKDTHAWFVGFAPSDHPQIVVAAIIERGGEGGASAAAVVRKVMAAYFGLSHPLPQPPFRVDAGAGGLAAAAAPRAAVPHAAAPTAPRTTATAPGATSGAGSPGRSSAAPPPVTNPASAGRSAP